MEGIQLMFTGIGRVAIEPFTVREPKEKEVVVKIEYTLISAGTEKAYLKGEPNTRKQFPVNIGYSGVGIIVQKGKLVSNYREGDRVFVAYGGHTQYSIVNTNNIFKVPEGVRNEDAVFTKIASYPLLGLRRTRMEMGESVVIVGLGMLGLLGIQLAKIGGGIPVIGIGNREMRRKKAYECGADYVYSPDEENLVKIIKEKTAILNKGGADVVIETSGNIDGLLSALKYTSQRGRISITGCNRVTDKPIDLYEYIHKKGLSIIGGHEQARLPYNSAPGNWTAKRDYCVLLNYMKEGRLKPGVVCTEIITPQEAPEMYGRLINGNEFPLGVLVRWN